MILIKKQKKDRQLWLRVPGDIHEFVTDLSDEMGIRVHEAIRLLLYAGIETVNRRTNNESKTESKILEYIS